MAPNAAYGGRHHLIKSDFSNTPVLGAWQMQIRKVADSDFKSLDPEDIRNTYLVLGFETS